MCKKILSISLALLIVFQLFGCISFTSAAENYTEISHGNYANPTLIMPEGTVNFGSEDGYGYGTELYSDEIMTYHRYEAQIYNSDLVSYSLPEVDLNGSSDFGDLSKYANTYGYDYLGTMTNGAALQQFYKDLDALASGFHTNYTVDAIGGVVGTINYSQYGISIETAMSVWMTYKNDHPLYYWISNSISYTYDSLFLMVDDLYSRGSDRKVYNIYLVEKINEWKNLVNGETSAYKKALFYHDKIINTIDYAYEADGITPEDDVWAHNILGVFEMNGGVCESYAKTFQLMLNVVGVENIVVTGIGNGGPHMWNLVKLDDGQWYWCDITWDDTPEWELGISYNYFCVNDFQNVSDMSNYIETFLSLHAYNGPSNVADWFLYELPARSTSEYSGNNVINTTFTVDGITYEICGFNTLRVLYIDINGDAIIPEQLVKDNVMYTVVTLGDFNISCILSDGVTSVHIPKSVSFIWDLALSGQSLRNITVDAENNTFRSLDGVLFTKSLNTLISYPLGNPRTEYSIPDETCEIAYPGFSNCSNLEEVYIPDSVTEFYGDFFGCTSLKKVRLPKNLATLNSYMFGYCFELEQIVIPSSVTQIGEFAFYGCSNLKAVYFLGNAPSMIGMDAFSNTSADCIFYYIEDTLGWTSPTWRGPDGKEYKTEKFILEDDEDCGHTDLTEYTAVETTCIELGHNLYYICNDCGSVLKADKKTLTTIEDETHVEYSPHKPGSEALGESPKVCTVCGNAINDSSPALGDVNGDGLINLDDVVKLLRHVSKADIITDPEFLEAGEIVEDGILNLDDVVRLLRFVSKAIPSLR